MVRMALELVPTPVDMLSIDIPPRHYRAAERL